MEIFWSMLRSNLSRSLGISIFFIDCSKKSGFALSRNFFGLTCIYGCDSAGFDADYSFTCVIFKKKSEVIEFCAVFRYVAFMSSFDTKADDCIMDGDTLEVSSTIFSSILSKPGYFYYLTFNANLFFPEST
jgi:hypothetical protein